MEKRFTAKSRKGDGMNRKGIVENGVIAALIAIVTAVGSTGIIFGGSSPIGSAFFVTSSAMVAYSQSPHVKDKFRRDKAVGMCEETGATDCDVMVQSGSDADVAQYVQDCR